MNLSEIFVRRPVMTLLVMLGILTFGVVAYRQLPVAQLPNVDFPTIQVRAELPGASPETMAAAVATPLEKQFSTIAGVDQMTSSSTQGTTQVTLQFALDRDIDAAAQDVQTAISLARRQLPSDMSVPPSYRKVNPADMPIFYLAVTSDTLPLYRVNEYAETLMAQRISMVSGVAQVQVYGSQAYAVRVQVDPQALAARRIGIDEVEQALGRANPNLPTGTLQDQHRSASVMTNGQLQDAAAFNDVIVTYRNGAPVRVRDIGRAIDDVQNNRMAAWYNDKRGIVLAIQRQPGTNTVQVVDEIRKLLPQFRAQIPPGIDVEVLYDRSEVHPRFGARGAVHPGAGAGAGDHGDLPVPAQPLGHPDPGGGAAHVHHRHVLGDVPGSASAWTPCRCWRSRCAWASWWTTPSSCWRTSRAISRWARPRCRPRSTARARSLSPSCP